MKDYTDVKHPVWADSEKKGINCSVKFTWVDNYLPFTASLADCQDYGKKIYEECVAGKWGEIADYVSPGIDYAALAERERQQRLDEANRITADWRVELMLGTITEADKASLTAWMAYISALKAYDFSDVNDEASYEAINWPAHP